MRGEMLKRLDALTARVNYALIRGELDYLEELLEERELCIKAIKEYNEETNSPLTEEERHLLECIKVRDERNKQILEDQFEQVKVKLRNIRINETRSMQYTNTYGSWQEGGVFFDKKEY